MSNLKQRLSLGITLAVLVGFVIWASKPFFLAIITWIVISGALWEYYQIARHKNFKPVTSIGMIGCGAYVFATLLSTQFPSCEPLPVTVLAMLCLILFVFYFISEDHPIENIAITIFGIVYITLTLAHIISITYFFSASSPHDGRLWLMYLIVVTKMTDTIAYFAGKKFGNRLLAPVLSPKKTLEGTIAGTLAAMMTSFLLYMMEQHLSAFSGLTLTWMTALVLGLLIGVIAQVGDLAESLLKRDAGIKDSGHLPGLGGILDIVDSLIFTTPLVYLFLQCTMR